MITFEGVEKVYESGGQKVHALNGIDLHVDKGKYTASSDSAAQGKAR